jgi:serine/threonine protein kinase
MTAITVGLLDEAMAKVAEGAKPWETGTFGLVKTLQSCERNHGRVDMMRSLEDGGLDVAVKRMPNRWVTQGPAEFAMHHPGATEQPWQDLGILRLLAERSFPFCCDLLGLHRDREHTYVTTSLCTEGDLLTWCNQGPPPGEKREAMLRPVAAQIFAGVRLLHELGVAHCDLSMENILLTGGDGGLRVQIIDFGMATLSRTCRGAVRGKPSYQAPEMHTDMEYDAYLADAFALGVVLFTMSAYDYPWASTAREACPLYEYAYGYGLRKLLAKKRLRFAGREPLLQLFSDSLVALLEGLLESNPEDRWGIARAGGADPNKEKPQRLVLEESSWLAAADRGK